ncbi:MAG TPA: aldo/keto reductase [Terriglobales bacterium]|nr:aldo/keto reductase [Terriglobales bacterium]
MQYTSLGNTGLIVSRLSLGVMTFGQGQGTMASVSKTDEKSAADMIHRAMDAGINFFDSADAYANGQSETILGRALGARRRDVIISTKVGFRSGEAITQTGASYRYLLAAAEACLQRLGTDYLDLLSIHKPDPYTPFEEMLRGLDNLVQRGLVRYVGYSNFSAWQAAKCIGIQQRLDYAPFVAAQMYYSLVGRDIEHEIVPFLVDAGVGLVVWSPLASGFLSGKYTRDNPTGGGGRIAGFDFLPTDRERGYDLIELMKKIAEAHHASVAQVALAWLLAKPFVSTVLLGASKMSQLEDNLGACEEQFTAEELRQLDDATAPAPLYPQWFQEKTLDTKLKESVGQRC